MICFVVEYKKIDKYENAFTMAICELQIQCNTDEYKSDKEDNATATLK